FWHMLVMAGLVPAIPLRGALHCPPERGHRDKPGDDRRKDITMPGRLAGKIAIFTRAGGVGPGWGTGRATAVLFAQEGAKVFAVDKSRDAMAETLARIGNEGEIVDHYCDVTVASDVAAMVAACRDQFGRIDILVNNVGGS